MSKIEIINGDCLEILESLPKAKYCIVTDPPFNMNYHYKSYKDNMPEEDYIRWISDVVTKLNSPFVIIHYPESIYKIAVNIGKAPDRVISWVYNSNTKKQHRDIAFFGVAPDFSKVKQPYKNPNDKRIKERIARGCDGASLYDWWYVDQVKNVSKKEINHPCVMPLDILTNVIGILPDDYIIVDPFCGSGTTGIACKRYNRDFIGIDIEKEYCDIAQNRIDSELIKRNLFEV